MTYKRDVIKELVSALIIVLCWNIAGRSSTRTLETHFALSADSRSEFSTRFPVLSEGRILIEAQWTSPNIAKSPATLTLLLIQPDGTTVSSRSGTSILRLEHLANEPEIDKFAKSNEPKWTVKIINDADKNRREVSGVLRITIPATSRTLEDTQFTLLGSGNAQEIPFIVPAPGKLEVDVSWEVDVLAKSTDVALVVSLIHPGESKTFARRQGVSPIRVEHQVTEQALDRGGRWIVRIQNDTQTKVAGRLKITYTPSL
jgi:hypothetical protein